VSLHHEHPAPKTASEWRRRYVRMLQVDVGLIDTPNASSVATMPKSRDARQRVVELLCIDAGLPSPTWARSRPCRPDPIDVAPIRAAWNELQRDRLRRYEEYDIALENRGSRARCRVCDETLLEVPDGLVGIAPSVLYVMHAKETGCC
jgi:hypothetical protein